MNGRSAPPGDPRRRTIDETRTLAMLAAYGWALAPDLGGDEPARLLDRLVAGGLRFAEAGGARLFDPAEAINRTIAAGLAGREPAWRERFVATGRALVRSLDPAAPLQGPPAPRRFEVSFTRRFALGGLSGKARLRLPRPIEDAALADLRLRIEAPDLAETITETPGRIELRYGPATDARAEATAGWTARFTGEPAARLADEPDRSLWLAPDEGLVRVTPAVRALAAALAGSAPDDRAVARFRDHLLDRFACGIVDYAAIAGPPPDHVLATGWYDCQLGAALLVALCRARGIPARLVGGFLLWPAPARHVWCEVWLAGWRPFDLLAWDLSAGARDPAWRDSYAGWIDHRLKMEVLPGAFAGPMSLMLPAAHHRLIARTPQGIAIDHRTLDDRPLWRDTISVRPDPA